MRTENHPHSTLSNIVTGNFGPEPAGNPLTWEPETHAEYQLESVLSQSSLDGLVDIWKPLPARKYLFRQGEPFKGVFFVRSGAIKTLHTMVSGQEQITAFHQPGDLIGFDGYQSGLYSTSAVTLETASVCFLPQKYLLSGKLEHSALDQHLMMKLSEIQNRQYYLSMTLSRNKADERIAAFLLDLSNNFARRNYSAVEFRLAMSRTELSSYLGLTVETICRAFQSLEKASLVKCTGRDIQIVNYDALAVLAGTRAASTIAEPVRAVCN